MSGLAYALLKNALFIGAVRPYGHALSDLQQDCCFFNATVISWKNY